VRQNRDHHRRLATAHALATANVVLTSRKQDAADEAAARADTEGI
jgi:hypothetical protein